MNHEQPCPVSEEDLLLLAYGEGGEAAAAHAAECPRCREFLAEVRAARSDARLLASVEPPEAAVDAVRSAARRVAEKKRRPHLVFIPAGWRIPAALAATAVIALAAGWYGLGRKPTPTAAERTAWIAPINLAALESELESGLPEIGLFGDALALEDGQTSETNTDTAEASAWATAAPLPIGDGLEASLLAWGFYRDEESLDRMEVAVAEMESDLGISEGL